MENKVTEEVFEQISEKFLDDVFDSSSKLPRQEYITTIAEKQNWIFNSKTARAKVEEVAR
jgi:hypothetical protein